MYTNDNKAINHSVFPMFTEDELAEYETIISISNQVQIFTEEEIDERVNHYIAVNEEAAIYEVNAMRYGILPGTVEDFVMRLNVEDQRHVEAIIEDAAAYLVRGEISRNCRTHLSLAEKHSKKEKAINALFNSSLDDLLDVSTKEQLAYLTRIIE